MNIKFLSLSIGCSLLIFACVNRDDNRKIVEARAIHMKTMSLYDSLYHALEKEEQKVIELLETETDSQKVVVFQSISRSVDRSQLLLSTWEDSVIGVPGMTENDGHHHHHGDHDHNHDHGKIDEKAILNTLSDDEILNFQKAYYARLSEIADEIRQLLTTMEMNEHYGK